MEDLDRKERELYYERDFFYLNKDKKMGEIDLDSIKEEIKRRGIEACINVLKTGSINPANRKLAEAKLKEFLTELKVI